ncbi:MAG: energy transducer TonB [Flavobacteriaceae bacterium]
MRFLKLFVLAAVLFFGVVCAQETPKSLPVKSTEDKNIVLNYVDKEAVFPDGGVNGFRNLLASKVNTNKINEYENLSKEEVKKIKKLISQKKPISKTTISSVLTFIVELDGTISDISAKGENQSFNEEAELAVKAIQVKWIPGEVNGTKIKSLYSMPIKMRVK